MIRLFVFLAIIVMVAAGCKKMADKNNAGIININAEQAYKMIQESAPLVLDVRSRQEYDKGHLENATFIPVNELDGRLDEIRPFKDKPVIVYCHSGSRSRSAARVLVQNGFSKVYNMKNGIIEWVKNGYKLQ